MTAKRTPGKWRAVGRSICSPERTTAIATVHEIGDLQTGEEEAQANAAFIALACNLHEDLIDNLMAALCFIEDAESNPVYKRGFVKKRISDIRALLKKAGAI